MHLCKCNAHTPPQLPNLSFSYQKRKSFYNLMVKGDFKSYLLFYTNPFRTFASYYRDKNETIFRIAESRISRGSEEGRPYRYRYTKYFRPSNAIQSGRGISSAYDKEAASEVYHLRITLVPSRGYQCKISAGTWSAYLE